MEKTNYILYKTTNKINNKIYIGIHKTNDNEFDGYFGSGNNIKRAIKKYGVENFERKTLGSYSSLEEVLDAESKIVNDDFLLREDVYNITLGGNAPPSMKYWSKEDREKFLEKWTEASKIRAKYRNPSHFAAGLNHWSRNTQVVKDKNGNTLRISNDDPRLKNGELIPVNKNKITVKDKDGNNFSVSVDDPRYISGELVSVNKGIKRKMSEEGKKKKMRECPHCGKIGQAGIMNRWHFDNCKNK